MSSEFARLIHKRKADIRFGKHGHYVRLLNTPAIDDPTVAFYQAARFYQEHRKVVAIARIHAPGWRCNVSADANHLARLLVRTDNGHTAHGTIDLKTGSVRIAEAMFVPDNSCQAVGPRDNVAEWVELSLRFVLPRERHDEVIGDLLEEYKEDVASKYGISAARFWLIRHAFGLIGAAFHLRWWALFGVASELLKRYFG